VGAFAVVAGVAALAWLWLVLARGWFWRTDLRLPAGAAPPRWPAVAVVVPARDEAAVLPASLPGLLAQDYPGPVRLLLVDDGSTDGTGEIARRLAAAEPGADPVGVDRADVDRSGVDRSGVDRSGVDRVGPDRVGPDRVGAVGLDAEDRSDADRVGAAGRVPLTVLSPGPPPAGWAGKLWALRAGVAAAGDVDLLLFTDADIAHPPGSLTALVRAADGLDLVSLLARLRTETGWERLLIPAFGYFFAMLYPPRWSNRPGARTAAAAGGCVLVRPPALRAAGGIEAIRGALIDDVALARAVKRAGGRTWLGLADDVHSVRPYPRLADLWHMVARSAYTQLRHSPPLLLGTVLGLALLFGVPVAATAAGAVSGSAPLLAAGLAGWALMAASYLPTLRYHRLPPGGAALLPAAAGLYLAMTVDSARRHHTGTGAAWKGRAYQASQPP
jgi:hopene-associated glycosyltransferase HpnB